MFVWLSLCLPAVFVWECMKTSMHFVSVAAEVNMHSVTADHSHTVTRLCDNNVTPVLSPSHEHDGQGSLVRSMGFVQSSGIYKTLTHPARLGDPWKLPWLHFAEPVYNRGNMAYGVVQVCTQTYNPLYFLSTSVIMCTYFLPWHLTTT